ncbi:unnamed protein product [Phytophthora fragariaefolia]|uniref:Unnamed protein product n=1 Tax=Phytophthora fragariaefolia TaxID=1490495 RepID=A0A9W6X5Z4_9STRA|nr:unnamed protein product [Phytophthora fragariaefolia]
MSDGGVSDAELAACVAALQKLHGEEAHQLFQSSPRFKPLRTALVPLIKDLRAKFFHGNSAASDSSRQQRKRAKKVERARQKALDQQYVNNTKLRAERLARLAALQQQNPLLAAVPDGVAAADEPMLLKEDGEQAEVAEAENEEEKETEQLHYHRACYTCKVKFRKLHHFYDRMCPACAELNYKKRLQNADLRGHVAVVTGARVKIGYEITLKLLRSGAMVVATTRFPKDAAFRYAKEKDFEAWKDRLQIYGMDFRDLGVIDKFMDHIEETFGSLDILINNATQTIRRPVHYYKHLIECEVVPVPEDMTQVNQILRGNANLLGSASAAANADNDNVSVNGAAIVSANGGSSTAIAYASASASASVHLSQMPLVAEDQVSEETAALFPKGQVDNNQQQVDLRTSNSWVKNINQIETMARVLDPIFALHQEGHSGEPLFGQFLKDYTVSECNGKDTIPSATSSSVEHWSQWRWRGVEARRLDPEPRALAAHENGGEVGVRVERGHAGLHERLLLYVAEPLGDVHVLQQRVWRQVVVPGQASSRRRQVGHHVVLELLLRDEASWLGHPHGRADTHGQVRVGHRHERVHALGVPVQRHSEHGRVDGRPLQAATG